MPREIIVAIWCDVCFGQDEKTPGESFVIRVGVRKADKPRELVLCDVHQKEILQPMLDVLAGAPVYDDSSPAPAQPTIPGIPAGGSTKTSGGSKGPSTNRSGRARAGFMGPTLSPEEIPSELPVPVTKDDGEQVWSCPEKCENTTWSNRDRARPFQSLRLHMRQQHGASV